ncbi:hypothetical protein [Chryseobacterium indoltheticum]|uniref:hypothetical protein n=1 Tax=Chryseobacterium indoltheticum TaxID=254 RepID=UPI001911491F|nr:hypothetical protein [Chryseobacterium indoltheticum]QQQ26856.1 hypothetical protein JJL46_12055 [Chryseobacterium indoltheticum]
MKKISLKKLQKSKLSRNLLRLINAGDGSGANGLNTNNGGQGGCGVAPQMTSFINIDKYKKAYSKWLACMSI